MDAASAATARALVAVLLIAVWSCCMVLLLELFGDTAVLSEGSSSKHNMCTAVHAVWQSLWVLLLLLTHLRIKLQLMCCV